MGGSSNRVHTKTKINKACNTLRRPSMRIRRQFLTSSEVKSSLRTHRPASLTHIVSSITHNDPSIPCKGPLHLHTRKNPKRPPLPSILNIRILLSIPINREHLLVHIPVSIIITEATNSSKLCRRPKHNRHRWWFRLQVRHIPQTSSPYTYLRKSQKSTPMFSRSPPTLSLRFSTCTRIYGSER